jgi:chromosome segregation ATPase
MRTEAASVRVAKAAYTVQSLKARNKARDKATKLRWAAQRARLKLSRLERKAVSVRERIRRYEEKASRLDDEDDEARPADDESPTRQSAARTVAGERPRGRT